MFEFHQDKRRTRRLADQIKSELAWIIDRKLHIPHKGMITLTRVRMSTDLKIARVYFTVIGDKTSHKETELALRKASSFLKRELSSVIKVRHLPELRFFFDDTMEYSENINSILRKIDEEKHNQ